MVRDDLGEWLQRGGDHRLVTDDSGFSPYRVSFLTRMSSPFGSCTANSPSPRAIAGAQAALVKWQTTGESDRTVDALQQQTRNELKQALALSDDTTVALTPSGTDALYLVNAVIHRRDLHAHHVVVGASELGGGTVRACEGKTFSLHNPFDGPLGVDCALDGLAGRSSAEPVYLRDKHGNQRSDSDVDQDVAQRVASAMSDNTCVVVHMVAHSKTGLRAPSLSLGLRLLEQYGQRVMVFVDAAQGRIAASDIHLALDSGFVVLFTGSKFYGGPPFSGALFLPQDWSADPGPLPASIGDWLDAPSLPEAWPVARESLATRSNPGLMLRWRAAMAEIIAYHALEQPTRESVARTFSTAVREVLGRCSAIRLASPPTVSHGLASGIPPVQTVFSFRVQDANGWLDAARLKTLHTQLDEDGNGPHGAHHLGQPVALGPPSGDRNAVLRVALGARLVSDLAVHPDHGDAWLRDRLHKLCCKFKQLLQVEGATRD